jgi:hypothetical protein
MEEGQVVSNTADLLEKSLQKVSGQPIYSYQQMQDKANQANAENEANEFQALTANSGEPSTTSATPTSSEPDDESKTFYSLFEKHTGKKYEEAQSLLSRKAFEEEAQERFGKPLDEIEKVVKSPSREYKSEYSKKLEEWMDNGGVEKDFHDLQRQNWEEVSADELIKSELKAKYPNADNSKIDALFRTEYKLPKPLDPDVYSEEEVEERQDEIDAAKMKLELKADELRQNRIAQKVKALESPLSPKLTPEQEIQRQRLQEKAENNAKKVFDDFEKFKGLNLSFAEKINGKDVVANLSFDLEKEQREQVDYILQNPTKNFMESFFDKEGNLDSQRFIKAVTLFVAGEKAAEKMAKDLAHEKLEAHIRGLKNANFVGAETTMPLTEQSKRNQELAKKILYGG